MRTVGSFATSAKIRNGNSLAFVDGVRIYERFFLGDEFTIRGYNVRSISPVTPLDNFITSRNVVLATNVNGTRSEEHTSELQSQSNLVCRLLLEKKKPQKRQTTT